ncbi:MAG: COR domain-containing protein, partial [Alphaproteobacteria bacterium]
KDDRGNPRFTVSGNPLPSLPDGLSESGDAVLDFLAGLTEGSELCNEVKTVLVGEGKAGKTTLLNRLTKSKFIPDQPETVALEIGHYDIAPPDGNGSPLHLNVWDFGGQDDYRSTQQFFFTAHALYLFLWDRRLNVDASNVRRWLSLVNKRAGKVKVLMIATHCCEGKGGKCQPHLFKPQDVARLDKAFPEMILPDILEIDCADPPYHVEDLKARLYAEAAAVHGQQDIHLPSKWMAARDKVLKRNATHIDFTDFADDCQQCGVTGSAVRSLLGMLSRQGRLVNYGFDEKLRDVVVLNAEWLMKAFAAVRRDRCVPDEAANALPETERPARYRAGFLHRDRLPLIWQDYPKDKHDLLLRLMIRHGLSYKITEDEWLVPELVPCEQPDLPWDDLNGDHNDAVNEFSQMPLVQYCQFGTEYDDEHDLDIIPGLMAVITQRSSYYFSKRDWFWQEGLFLRHPTDGTEALITLPRARQLRIETRGRYPGDLMTAMRNVIEEVIHERWPAAKQSKKPLYKFEVPCPEEDCEAKHLVSTLRKIENDKGAGALVTCTEGHEHSVSQLLRGLRPPEAPEWADKLDRKFDGMAKKLDRTLGLLEGIGEELDQLLSQNADVKQCLNFLSAARLRRERSEAHLGNRATAT